MKEKLYNMLQGKRGFRAYLEIKNGLPFPKDMTSNLTRFKVAIDYFVTRVKRNITLDEYFHFYMFYKLKRRARKEFFTNDEAHEFEAKLNQVRYIQELKDKLCFNRIFAPFIHRDYLVVKESSYSEFIKFLHKYKEVILKPNDSSMGRGIFKLREGEIANINEAFYIELQEKNYLCEQCVVAKTEIQSLHPASLNTIRVVTYCVNEKVEILWSFIRIGRENCVVDNGHSGGIWAMIDVESGLVFTTAKSTDGKSFLYHPDTDRQITGLVIPDWQQVIEVAKSAALHFPQAVVVGWDLAICEGGVIELIEGNSKPDIDMTQAGLEKGLKKELEKRCKMN